MKKTLLLLFVLGSISAFSQSVISGCITSAPDTLQSVRIAYLRGKSLAVKQDIPVVNGCFSAEKSFPETGIFIVYLDPEHSFDVVLSNGAVPLEIDYNNITAVDGHVRPIWTREELGVLSVWTALLDLP